MNRSQDDIQVLKKVNMIVKENLPGFASRYFSYNMDIKTPRTLWGYAIDLTSFFEYLETISFHVDKMVISDLDSITPEIIENYLEHSKMFMDNGKMKTRSDAAEKRRYSTLSSFFSYYYKLEMIDRNPVDKVTPPYQKRYVTKVPTNSDNKELLDFVSSGDLEGKKAVFQERTRNRDIAILLLIMGAGIKASECVNIDLTDLHLESGYITVKNRKSNRNVYVSDYIAQAISRYLIERLSFVTEYGHEDALFISLKYKRICLRSIEIMLKKYSEAVFGTDNNVTAEALKQAFRNNLFNQTMNFTYVADFCGNEKDTIFLNYKAAIEEYEYRKGTEFSFNMS